MLEDELVRSIGSVVEKVGCDGCKRVVVGGVEGFVPRRDSVATRDYVSVGHIIIILVTMGGDSARLTTVLASAAVGAAGTLLVQKLLCKRKSREHGT